MLRFIAKNLVIFLTAIFLFSCSQITEQRKKDETGETSAKKQVAEDPIPFPHTPEFLENTGHGYHVLRWGDAQCVKCHGEKMKEASQGSSTHQSDIYDPGHLHTCMKANCHDSAPTKYLHKDRHAQKYKGKGQGYCLSCHDKFQNDQEFKKFCSDCHHEDFGKLQTYDPKVRHGVFVIRNSFQKCQGCHGPKGKGTAYAPACIKEGCHTRAVSTSKEAHKEDHKKNPTLAKDPKKCFMCHKETSMVDGKEKHGCYGCHHEFTLDKLELSNTKLKEKNLLSFGEINTAKNKDALHGLFPILNPEEFKKCLSCHGDNFQGSDNLGEIASCYRGDCHKDSSILKAPATTIKENHKNKHKEKLSTIIKENSYTDLGQWTPGFAKYHDKCEKCHAPGSITKNSTSKKVDLCYVCHHDFKNKEFNPKDSILLKATLKKPNQVTDRAAQHGYFAMLKKDTKCTLCHRPNFKGITNLEELKDATCYGTDCHDETKPIIKPGKALGEVHKQNHIDEFKNKKSEDIKITADYINKCKLCHQVEEASAKDRKKHVCYGCHHNFANQLKEIQKNEEKETEVQEYKHPMQDKLAENVAHGIVVLKSKDKINGCKSCHGNNFDGKETAIPLENSKVSCFNPDNGEKKCHVKGKLPAINIDEHKKNHEEDAKNNISNLSDYKDRCAKCHKKIKHKEKITHLCYQCHHDFSLKKLAEVGVYGLDKLEETDLRLELNKRFKEIVKPYNEIGKENRDAIHGVFIQESKKHATGCKKCHADDFKGDEFYGKRDKENITSCYGKDCHIKERKLTVEANKNVKVNHKIVHEKEMELLKTQGKSLEILYKNNFRDKDSFSRYHKSCAKCHIKPKVKGIGATEIKEFDMCYNCHHEFTEEVLNDALNTDEKTRNYQNRVRPFNEILEKDPNAAHGVIVLEKDDEGKGCKLCHGKKLKGISSITAFKKANCFSDDPNKACHDSKISPLIKDPKTIKESHEEIHKDNFNERSQKEYVWEHISDYSTKCIKCHYSRKTSEVNYLGKKTVKERHLCHTCHHENKLKKSEKDRIEKWETIDRTKVKFAGPNIEGNYQANMHGTTYILLKNNKGCKKCHGDDLKGKKFATILKNPKDASCYRENCHFQKKNNQYGISNTLTEHKGIKKPRGKDHIRWENTKEKIDFCLRCHVEKLTLPEYKKAKHFCFGGTCHHNFDLKNIPRPAKEDFQKSIDYNKIPKDEQHGVYILEKLRYLKEHHRTIYDQRFKAKYDSGSTSGDFEPAFNEILEILETIGIKPNEIQPKCSGCHNVPGLKWRDKDSSCLQKDCHKDKKPSLNLEIHKGKFHGEKYRKFVDDLDKKQVQEGITDPTAIATFLHTGLQKAIKDDCKTCHNNNITIENFCQRTDCHPDYPHHNPLADPFFIPRGTGPSNDPHKGVPKMIDRKYKELGTISALDLNNCFKDKNCHKADATLLRKYPDIKKCNDCHGAQDSVKFEFLNY